MSLYLIQLNNLIEMLSDGPSVMDSGPSHPPTSCVLNVVPDVFCLFVCFLSF